MGTRFVEIPAEALVSCLDSIGASVAEKGGAFKWGLMGRERVFGLTPHVGSCEIHVYTTLADGDVLVRGCGDDAVRIVVGKTGTTGKFACVSARKMLRTAPPSLNESERVGTFLSRLTEAVREAYKKAGTVPVCPTCKTGILCRRKGKYGDFLGCSEYPVCKGTKQL